MKYNILGKTGEKVSQIGFGAIKIPIRKINENWYVDEDNSLPLFQKAYELGINYFDTAPYYSEDLSEIAVGEGVKKFRNDVLLASKFHINDGEWNEANFFKRLELSLKRLQTDYLDIYHMWSLTKAELDVTKSNGIFNSFIKAKEQGLIRHIGFSFYGTPGEVKSILDDTDIFELILLNNNVYGTSREVDALYAASKDMGLINEGALFLAGVTEKPAFREVAIQKGMNPYFIALKYVMSNKNYHSILSSFENVDELEKIIEFVEKNEPLTEEEFEVINLTCK